MVAGTVVASHRVYGTFLSRWRKGSRIGDEWALAWTPATVGIVDVVPGGQGRTTVREIDVIVRPREQEAVPISRWGRRKRRMCRCRRRLDHDHCSGDGSGMERRWWQQRWLAIRSAKDAVADWLCGAREWNHWAPWRRTMYPTLIGVAVKHWRVVFCWTGMREKVACGRKRNKPF